MLDPAPAPALTSASVVASAARAPASFSHTHSVVRSKGSTVDGSRGRSNCLAVIRGIECQAASAIEDEILACAICLEAPCRPPGEREVTTTACGHVRVLRTGCLASVVTSGRSAE